MPKFACVLLCLLAVACAGQGQPGEDEALEIKAEPLDAKPQFGAAGLLFGNTPYGDCLTECLRAKRSCEGEGDAEMQRDNVCRECDLAYSSCKSDCQRAFPHP